MSTEGWKNKEVVDVPRIQEYTFKVRPIRHSAMEQSRLTYNLGGVTCHCRMWFWRQLLME